MPILFLQSSNPSRKAALVEQLARWPQLELRDSPEGAEAALIDSDEVGPDLTFLGEIPHLLLTPKDRPLRWNLLAGRLSLLLNRVNTDEPFDIGPYTCLPLDRVLIDAEGEEKARLTDKEVALLATLAEAGAAGVPRALLLERVWGYKEDLETHTLETHIYRLRQKIEADPTAPVWLLTIEGGYKLGNGAA